MSGTGTSQCSISPILKFVVRVRAGRLDAALVAIGAHQLDKIGPQVLGPQPTRRAAEAAGQMCQLVVDGQRVHRRCFEGGIGCVGMREALPQHRRPAAVEGMDGIGHRLRAAPHAPGGERQTLAASAGQYDLAFAQGEGARRAQASRRCLAFLFDDGAHEQRGLHGQQLDSWLCNLPDCALGKEDNPPPCREVGL